MNELFKQLAAKLAAAGGNLAATDKADEKEPAVAVGGLGIAAGSGALNLIFGQNQQLEASKYQINANKAEEDNKTLMISLAFIGGVLLIIIIAVVIAMR